MKKSLMNSSRKKSCEQCRVAKTRCSLDVPTCLRCQKRHLSCKYAHRKQPSNQFPIAPTSMFNSWLASTNSEPMPLPAEGSAFAELDQNGALEMNDPRISGYLEFHTPSNSIIDDLLRPEPMEWVDQRRTLGSDRWTQSGQRASIQDAERITDEESVCWLGNQCSTSIRDESTSSHGQVIPITAKEGDVSSYTSVMKHSSKLVLASWQALKEVSDDLPGLPKRKQPTKLSSLMIGNFLWAKIESYVVEIGRTKILPPFIHRSCCKNDTGGRDLDFSNFPEPLANCFSIVPMYRQKTPACKHLVYRTLRLEVQRLHDEFQTYDEHTLTSALQALTIYAIIVAADEDRCKDISAFTGKTLVEICMKVNDNDRVSTSEAKGNFPTYEDWRRGESRRRTMILLHLMDMLIDMSIGKTRTPSCSQFDRIALPCCKAIWEAETKTVWELEYKNYLSTRKGSGMLKCGDLRQLSDLDVNSLGIDVVEDLSNWSKGVDSFGAMLLMAVPQGFT